MLLSTLLILILFISISSAFYIPHATTVTIKLNYKDDDLTPLSSAAKVPFSKEDWRNEPRQSPVS